MTASAVTQEVDAATKLEAEVDELVSACHGDMREVLRELITFRHFQN